MFETHVEPSRIAAAHPRIACGAGPVPQAGGHAAAGAAVRQGRDAAAARADPILRRQAHQGRADPRHQEARGPRHGDPHPQPAAPLPETGRARLRAEAQGDEGDRRPQRPRAPSAVKGDKLSITLDKAYGPGDTLDLAIEYSGSPERGIRFVLPDPAYPEKPLSIWTQGEAEDTHHWLPCYDYPNDRATSEMIITVEKPLFVLSNGVLVEHAASGRQATTYHWKMDVPHRQLPDLAGRRRLLRLSRQGRRPAGGLLRGQAGQRGDGAAVHGQDAAG